MGEVERVSVTHNFDSARERNASSMNTKTAWETHNRSILAFFATNVASERNPPPKGSQWVIVEFSFKFQNSTFHVKVEVATVTAISVFVARFITDLASALFFLFRINSFFVKKNKRM